MSQTLSLTYRELGERIGLSADGARMLARRRRWPITRGNDGRARVMVAADEIACEAERSAGRPAERAADPPDGQDGAHEAMITHLIARAAALEADRDRLAAALILAIERAARAEGEADALRTACRDLAERLDHAEHERRMPWWRRWLSW